MKSNAFFQIGIAIIVSTLMITFVACSSIQPGPDKKGNVFIEKFDRDKDGKVTKDEFPGPPHVFNRFDKNKDGVIDASEAPEGRSGG
ncbi:MAG: hypothetical protein B1H13_00020 [Desulfobacteraceae bacterium 4484_190.3]|nr:MAG: hypothetical protein B1H13_00020 [Desulfobacteraceae bacterium 4484_190.3]